MKTGKCLKCDAIGEVTEDHVIPDWYLKAVANFGIPKPEVQIEIICKNCNSKKGGKVDYSNEVTRKLAKDLVQKLVSEVRKHEEFNF